MKKEDYRIRRVLTLTDKIYFKVQKWRWWFPFWKDILLDNPYSEFWNISEKKNEFLDKKEAYKFIKKLKNNEYEKYREELLK